MAFTAHERAHDHRRRAGPRFRAAGALREGHFVLSSGLHSPVFLQKNLVFQHADRTERLCRALAGLITAEVGEVDAVVSPAVGGIIPGYETARHLRVRSLYVEREGGAFRLRRGFHLDPGARVAMVEDIVTTGLSSRECIAAIRETGAEVVCAACIVDRSGGRADVGRAPGRAWRRWTCRPTPPTPCRRSWPAVPVTDPGSRRLRA